MSSRLSLHPAVVLGGTNTALTVTRALGKAGVPVTVLDDGYTDFFVRRSRYCRQFVHFEPSDNSAKVPDRWLEWLLKASHPAVVLPACDEGLELVARHRPELLATGHLPIEADDAVLLSMLDKQTTYRLATQLGIGVPRTETVCSRSELAQVIEQGLVFPCAVKPARADHVARLLPDYPTPKGTVVHSRVELEVAATPMIDADLPVLVTEFIPGSDDRYCSYYSYLDENGEPLVHFTKRKLRQVPPRFGSGTYHVTQWQPDVAETGLRFFQGVGLRGFGNVEFKRDPRDDALKLIECNARFTLANGQVRAAGLDFALLAYNRLTGRELPPLDSFKDGVRLWYPIDDFRAFLAYRAEGELSTLGWLRSLLHIQHLSVFDWHDPGPSLVAALGRLRSWGLVRNTWRWNRSPRSAVEA